MKREMATPRLRAADRIISLSLAVGRVAITYGIQLLCRKIRRRQVRLADLTRSASSKPRQLMLGRDAVAVATGRYKEGNASYYEVLEAQQQLFPAENTLS